MGPAPKRTQQESFGPFPVRELIGISELDSRLQEQIIEHGSLKGFRVTMWRDKPDATGCNWNARIDRVKGTESDDSSWWDVVPHMRRRFNLA